MRGDAAHCVCFGGVWVIGVFVLLGGLIYWGGGVMFKMIEL